MNNARARLAEFLEQQGAPPPRAQEVTEAVEDALERFQRGVTPRPELAKKARRLVDDLVELQKLTKRVAAALDPAGKLYFFLRHSEALASGDDLGSPQVMAKGRGLDGIPRGVRESVMALATTLEWEESALREISAAARRVTDAHVLSRRGPPVDEARLMLGLELAHLWRHATGEAPTFSSEATPDAPRTPFGQFVALAVVMSPVEAELTNGFAYFVRSAVEGWRGVVR